MAYFRKAISQNMPPDWYNVTFYLLLMAILPRLSKEGIDDIINDIKVGLQACQLCRSCTTATLSLPAASGCALVAALKARLANTELAAARALHAD